MGRVAFLVVFPFTASALRAPGALRSTELLALQPKNVSVQDELHQLTTVFEAVGVAEKSWHEATVAKMKVMDDGAKPLKAPTDVENPKCDQACSTGNERQRALCNFECAKMQKKICGKDFSCHRACGNHVKQIPKDVNCESLCADVALSVCYPLGFEGPKGAVSPHHDAKPPPSMEQTPAPRKYTGTFVFCNLYPASYEFDVVALKAPNAKEGKKLTSLSYKQCDKIKMESTQVIALQAKGKTAAVSKPILKVPSVMLFGQWAFGNHQVEFNRYFAKGDGPVVCNGFPMWEAKDRGQPIQFRRDGKKIAALRYKECMPSSLKNGEVLSADIQGQRAGEYKVVGSPSAIVLGKAGETTAVAFEAWTDNEVSL